MTWRIKEQVPAFGVSDLDLAIDFYARIGFQVEWRWPKREPTHVGLRRDSCALMLTLSDDSACGEIYYVVDDVPACYEAVLIGRPWDVALAAREATNRIDPPAASLRSPEAPEVRDHGHLDFTLLDPWGHRLSFGCEAVV